VRALYLLASYLLTPVMLLYLALRGLGERGYLERWGERFALYRDPPPSGGIVIHAASVGEVVAAAPLVRALQERFPGLPVTVTSFTPTGSERTRALFGGGVTRLYLPFDLAGAVSRFLDRLEPRLLIIMETELWPNLFFAAGDRNIPLLLSNARISDRSYPSYRRLRPLVRRVLGQVSRVAAQSETDAARLIDLGAAANRVEVTGNLKYDLELPHGLESQGSNLRRQWGEQRPVLLAASTHEGDEEPVLQAFKGLLETHPDALLVLAPRHPDRFEPVGRRARQAGLRVQPLSEEARDPARVQCVVVDRMGELLPWYAACDVAFVGGSLDRTGGHNLIEPAAIGVPVLVGPHTFHFAEITARMLAGGGARLVNDAAELQRAAGELLGDAATRQSMGEAAAAVASSGRGALQRTVQLCAALLDPFGS